MVPSSPTDQIYSPCTKAIWMRKKKAPYEGDEVDAASTTNSNVLITFPYTAFPVVDKLFILGTSSANRKNIVDAMNWKYIQMAPDIDGIIAVILL